MAKEMINKEIKNLLYSDEGGRSSPPTKEDIEETAELLEDFHIHTVMPKFTSRTQMYRWRKETIKAKLEA